MKKICPIHKVELDGKSTKYGPRYSCPVEECTVVLWGGSTSTPADEETRQLRIKCHNLFDKRWNTRKRRNQAYLELSHILGIKKEECHFGMFNKEQCEKALKILNGDY